VLGCVQDQALCECGFVHLEDGISVSAKSVYNKINEIEPEVSRQLVCQSAARVIAVIAEMGVVNESPIPGYKVRIIDGNHHPASEHQLRALRDVAAPPLPGLFLVVFDPVHGIVLDCLPFEDGHKQERALNPETLNEVEGGTVWIADRNFCTCSFMLELALHEAYFVVRRHAQTGIELKGALGECGSASTGKVFEQLVVVTDCNGEKLNGRLITPVLDQPTRDGDLLIQILTNLPESVSALMIAESYRRRWKIENVNLELMKHFASEQTSLGNPPATLFAFCVSIVAFNLVQPIHISLRAAHGEEATFDKISNYYLAHALQGGWESTQLIEESFWIRKYSSLTPKQLAADLIRIATSFKLSQFRKSKRGPKLPGTPRTRFNL
jgi:Transposase DDE domain